MRFSSISMPGSGMISEPVAMMIALASIALRAVRDRRSRAGPGDDAPLPLSQSTLFFLNRNSTPRVSVADDLVLARQHGLEVELDVADLDAVRGERVPGLGEFLR